MINRTTHPRWNERFDLYTFADQSKMLELTVHDRDTRREETIGRCNVNLLYLAPDDTRDLYIGLQTQPETDVAEACILNPTDLQRTCQPYVRLMITVSGQPPNSLPHTLDAQQTQPLASLQPLSDYRLWHTLRDLSDVGLLTVTVHRAEQLLARDFNGKSDPFCVLQLGNCRVQTHTEYKTLTPEWQKTFHLRVRDIHHTLLISLFDEDSNKQFEFLGCVSIPLLTIKNGCHWYQLKSKSLTQPTKGQIMLEFRLQYNVLRAVWNTLHPQEKRRLDESETLRWKKAYNRFKENWLRVKNLFQSFVDVATYLDSCMRWDCPLRSAFAYLAFCLITLYFELWMLPVLILVPLLRNLFRFKLTGHPTDEDQVNGATNFNVNIINWLIN